MARFIGRFAGLARQHTAVFTFTIVAIFLLVLKIPVREFLDNYLPEETARNVDRLVEGTIIIVAGVAAIRGLGLKKIAGIALFRIKKPWLLLLPVIYPLSLSLPGILGADLSRAIVSSLLLAFAAALSKGLAEEVAIRGLLQSYLVDKYRERWSVYKIVHLQAAVFALMHVVSLVRYSYVDVINQVMFAFYWGVLAGALVMHVRNVIVVGLLHGIMNFAFAIDNLTGSNATDGMTEVEVTTAEVIEIIATYNLLFLPVYVMGLVLLRSARRHLFLVFCLVFSQHNLLVSPWI